MKHFVRRVRKRLSPVLSPDWTPQLASESLFWQTLGADHARDLDRFGVDAMKRHQALAYFTWQWNPLSAIRDPQVRFLLTHSSPRQWLSAWRNPELSDEAWANVRWSRLKRRIYTWTVRLLWDYALEHGDRRAMALHEPLAGSPLPVRWRGRLVSQDLANTALELRTMAPALRAPRSFLEVGAGYGRTAHALLTLFPDARYTIVDIEPALSIARWYLTQFFDADRISFLAPSEADAVESGSVSVALSISTLQEMTPSTVASYLQLFDRAATGGYVYLKQWTSWRNGEDRVRMAMADYPFPGRWERVIWRHAAVQSRFTEGLWAVPLLSD